MELTKKLAAKRVAVPEALPAPRSSAGKIATVPSVPRHTDARSFKGDTAEMIKHMRTGTPASVIPDIADKFGMSQEGLFAVLRLPRRISKNALLSASEQDRMYRADRIWTRAVEVFEEDESARAWIKRKNRSLGGETPLALLDTEVGYELVLDTLGRIEHGIVS